MALTFIITPLKTAAELTSPIRLSYIQVNHVEAGALHIAPLYSIPLPYFSAFAGDALVIRLSPQGSWYWLVVILISVLSDLYHQLVCINLLHLSLVYTFTPLHLLWPELFISCQLL